MGKEDKVEQVASLVVNEGLDILDVENRVTEMRMQQAYQPDTITIARVLDGSIPDPDHTNPKDLVGVKKPPLDLVPPALMIHAAEAMRNGAEKYGPYNWRDKDVRARIYVGAAVRHLLEWLDGAEVADDSGVHHLGHAAACCGILLDAQSTGHLVDDRPTAGAASRLIAELTKP